jgi:hypothetical protein
MKTLFITVALFLVVTACSRRPATQNTVRIPTGIETGVLITFAPRGGGMRAVFDHPEREDVVIVEGTNVTLRLNVAPDGAVYGIQTDWGHIDMITHIVQQETGVTNICNPVAVVDGVTNDIISVWSKLGRTDPRFTINRAPKDSNM